MNHIQSKTNIFIVASYYDFLAVQAPHTER